MPRGVSEYDSAYLHNRLWTPSLIRPAFWLDANDLSTISISTGVSEWRDKSGNNRHVSQSTEARRPTYSETGFNGRPTVSAVATSKQWISTNTNLSGFSGSGYLWAFSACSMSSSASWYGRLLSYNQVGRKDYNTSDLTAFLIREASNNKMQTQRGGALSTANVTPDTNMLVGSVYGNPNNIFYVNGTGATPSSYFTSFNSSPRLTIFWDNDTDFQTYWDGKCSEMILGDFEISDVDRQKIEGYLAWKWGLVDKLPSTHPFITRPPLLGD